MPRRNATNEPRDAPLPACDGHDAAKCAGRQRGNSLVVLVGWLVGYRCVRTHCAPTASSDPLRSAFIRRRIGRPVRKGPRMIRFGTLGAAAITPRALIYPCVDEWRASVYAIAA